MTDTAPINKGSWFTTDAEKDLVKAAREKLAARKAEEKALQEKLAPRK